MASAYFLLAPDDDFFPVYTDPNCNIPFDLTLDGIIFVQSGLMLAGTGEGGAHAKWSAKFFFKDGAKDDEDDPGPDEDNLEEEGLLFIFALFALGGNFPDKGPEIDARWYGITRFFQAEFAGEKFYIPIIVTQPPTIQQALQNPDAAFMTFIYP